MATDGASSLDRRNSTPTTPVPASLQRLIAEISISFKHTGEVGKFLKGRGSKDPLFRQHEDLLVLSDYIRKTFLGALRAEKGSQTIKLNCQQ